jgi:hypothetical protein
MALELRFKIAETKIITTVELAKPLKGKIVWNPYDAVFDPGSSYTTMSESLFDALGYEKKESAEATLIGINSESAANSYIVGNFKLGGQNLGKVRVTVGRLSPQFESTVILGMNLLMWFEIAIKYHPSKKIILAERNIQGIDKTTRFTRKDMLNVNIVSETAVLYS